MKRLIQCLVLSLVSGTAFAETSINAKCPIGKEAVVASAGSLSVGGKTVGFCCPGCIGAFQKWDANRQSAFVAQALAESGSHAKHDAGEHKDGTNPTHSEPYALSVCAKTGAPLGSMGDPVVEIIEGREVKFCCAGCTGGFKKDTAASFAKLDALMVADQKRFYPTRKCIVSGEPIDEAKDMIIGNRLFRVCCGSCKNKIVSNPTQYLAELNKEVAEAQRPDYPMTTCVIAGSKLGSMGEPTETVIAGRLIRFCCAGCEAKAKADPSGTLAKIDAAWKAKGKYLPNPKTQKDNAHADHSH